MANRKCPACKGEEVVGTPGEMLVCPECFGSGKAQRIHKMTWLGGDDEWVSYDFECITPLRHPKVQLIGSVYWDEVSCGLCLRERPAESDGPSAAVLSMTR